MANKKITDLPQATEIGEVETVQSGTSRRVRVWQDGWDWSANGDALPLSWPVGGYGYGIGERYAFGVDGYVPADVFILRKTSGTTEADFLIR